MTEHNLQQMLRLWQELADVEAAGIPGSHLTEEELYHLAEPGGMQRAADEALEHLSLCATCQKRWAVWLDSLEILAEDVALEEDRLVSFGFLRAASASLFTEPVSLESSCGRFELSVFPERDNPARGMVVLEVKSVPDNLQTRYCVVRDGTGAIILQGMLYDGRLAGRVDELARLDLKTWTVIVGTG